MAKFYNRLEPSLQAFIARQKMFFTATAPHEGPLAMRARDDFAAAV